MKRSELKQLIREVVEEVYSQKNEGIFDFFKKKKKQPEGPPHLQRDTVIKVIEKLIPNLKENLELHTKKIEPLEKAIKFIERKLRNSSLGTGKKLYSQGNGYYSERPDQDYEYWTKPDPEPERDGYKTHAEYDEAYDYQQKLSDKLSKIHSSIYDIERAEEYFSKKLDELSGGQAASDGGEISHDLYRELFYKYQRVQDALETKDETVDKFFV